jgi:hypothetical protein
LKAEGYLTHAEIIAMDEEDLAAEVTEFIEYHRARNEHARKQPR